MWGWKSGFVDDKMAKKKLREYRKICVSKTLACPDRKKSPKEKKGKKSKKRAVFHSLMSQFYTKPINALKHGFSGSATHIFCCKCRISKATGPEKRNQSRYITQFLDDTPLPSTCTILLLLPKNEHRLGKSS